VRAKDSERPPRRRQRVEDPPIKLASDDFSQLNEDEVAGASGLKDAARNLKAKIASISREILELTTEDTDKQAEIEQLLARIKAMKTNYARLLKRVVTRNPTSLQLHPMRRRRTLRPPLVNQRVNFLRRSLCWARMVVQQLRKF
jgi:septal ring factor EnvC (AmiA/AmiB activator)